MQKKGHIEDGASSLSIRGVCPDSQGSKSQGHNERRDNGVTRARSSRHMHWADFQNRKEGRTRFPPGNGGRRKRTVRSGEKGSARVIIPSRR